MNKLKSFNIWLFLILAVTNHVLAGQESPSRQVIPLNKGWQFYFGYDVNQNPKKNLVTLPHTWNAADVLAGVNYKRETGIYEKQLLVNEAWKNRRLFLYFEGANSVASVFINHHFVSEHHGGYTAFCVEITDFVKQGSENLVTVQVSNAYRSDVLPLSGDFNIYGGIHRPVSLITTSKNCITPLDYASSGIYLSPRNVSDESAQVEVVTKLLLQNADALTVRTTVLNSKSDIVAAATSAVNGNEVRQTITLKKPHLWNGKADPYLYQARVQLMRGQEVIDEVLQPLGLRYYHVDAEKGFMLNGKHLDLHGLGLHEDVKGKGSALSHADEERDMMLIKEIGATALRLTHYPHQKYFYDLCDKNGLVVWSEIPLVGPGGYTGTGYIKSDALENQAKQVLTELIRQNYNHPSICFWGLFNELKLNYDDPVPFIKELDTLAKKEDPSRLTTCATFVDNDTFNQVSDLIAWNKYYGWYGGNFADMGTWADKTHHHYPQKPIAISEYGAGGSPFKHQENVSRPRASGKFHPEEWQTLYHEKNWQELNARPYIWAKFVWVLADFGSSIRTEGDTSGINDKGLVTYDRSIKKDAFYFYKANWNTDPMVYIAEGRNNQRTQSVVTIKAYSNLSNVSLLLNGLLIKKANPDAHHTIRWENINLRKGINKIEIRATHNKKQFKDSCEWTLDTGTSTTKSN